MVTKEPADLGHHRTQTHRDAQLKRRWQEQSQPQCPQSMPAPPRVLSPSSEAVSGKGGARAKFIGDPHTATMGSSEGTPGRDPPEGVQECPLLDMMGWCSSEREASGGAGGSSEYVSVLCVCVCVCVSQKCGNGRNLDLTGILRRKCIFLGLMSYQKFPPRTPKGSGKLNWVPAQVVDTQWQSHARHMLGSCFLLSQRLPGHFPKTGVRASQTSCIDFLGPFS